jgi:hypothetical protein
VKFWPTGKNLGASWPVFGLNKVVFAGVPVTWTWHGHEIRMFFLMTTLLEDGTILNCTLEAFAPEVAGYIMKERFTGPTYAVWTFE